MSGDHDLEFRVKGVLGVASAKIAPAQAKIVKDAPSVWTVDISSATFWKLAALATPIDPESLVGTWPLVADTVEMRYDQRGLKRQARMTASIVSIDSDHLLCGAGLETMGDPRFYHGFVREGKT